MQRCLEDARTFRDADCSSEHQLVVTRFKLKIKTVIKPQRSIVESLKEVAQEVVEYNRKTKEQWISESTWDIIDQRAKVKILVNRHEHNTTCTREYLDDLKAHYIRPNKQVKTRTRNDKRVYLETMADQAEVTSRWRNSRTVYAITTEVAGISKASSTQVENEEGILIIQIT
ncbi:hypothetical protein QYM36_010042 [Artemia franciscana]|uniref:Uncharacterized protein n=1 Tax=Artemia franciscana TaxID=6661 RepID=A0AA88L3F8_ARTSF|nr:hypothetical protein QYM36_010042 [Artemia franciscana]